MQAPVVKHLFIGLGLLFWSMQLHANVGFALASQTAVGNFPVSVAVTVIDGDGWPDLICANIADGALSVLTKDEKGNFVLATNLSVGPNASTFFVTTADVNGDGRLDLITTDPLGNTLLVYTNALTFLPRLATKNSGNNCLVSWASPWAPSAGWTLQQNGDLSTTNWVSFSGTIGDDGVTKTATNSLTPGNRFFRLSHF